MSPVGYSTIPSRGEIVDDPFEKENYEQCEQEIGPGGFADLHAGGLRFDISGADGELLWGANRLRITA